MKILLTGVTGYIAQRLLPILIENQHEVICCVRDKSRFDFQKFNLPNSNILEINFLDLSSVKQIPQDIDVAYYLIHSMSVNNGNFEDLEEKCAKNFIQVIEQTKAKQIIYLSGIINENQLSKHLSSRKKVENLLAQSKVPLTTLRAGIIVGSGSASFEIIRDLVEKLPIMITPKWLKTKCQPIAIRNVIQFLYGVLNRHETFNQNYDIGGPDILSYKMMLLRFAKIRKLKRTILVVPVMTPKLSSYWLYFVTATSYHLAKNLVNSMKVEVVCKPNNLAELLQIQLISYDEAIKLAFDKIEQNQIISSWKDARSTAVLDRGLSQYVEVPVNGCFIDSRKYTVKNPEKALQKIWQIGGKTGWYYGNWLWKCRGFIDQLTGGVGMRRGRRNPIEIVPGDSLDFWRVLLADKIEKRLLLYAEMRLPGEAWLEFKIEKNTLIQTATFRPLGLWGRIYWYAVYPFHGFIFNGMIKNIGKE